MSEFDLTQKDYEEALKSGIDPKHIPHSVLETIWRDHKEIAFASIEKGFYFSPEALAEAPSKSLSGYIANGGTIYGILTEDEMQKLSEKDVFNAIESENCESHETIDILMEKGIEPEDIPIKSVGKSFSNGDDSLTDGVLSYGDPIYFLTHMSQKNINEGVEKGGKTLHGLCNVLYDNRSNYVHSSAGKSGGWQFTEDGKKLKQIIENIPKESIVRYYENGGEPPLFNFTANIASLKDLSAETKTKYIANGGNAQYLNDEDITLQSVIERASNCENFNNKNFNDGIPNEMLEEVPTFLKDKIFGKANTSEETKSLVLFAAGKAQLEDLPQEVFIHPKTRKALLKIIKIKNPNNYDKIKKIVEEKQQDGINSIVKQIQNGTKIEKFTKTPEGQAEIKKDEKKYSSPETPKGKDKKKPGEENTTEDQQTI